MVDHAADYGEYTTKIQQQKSTKKDQENLNVGTLLSSTSESYKNSKNKNDLAQYMFDYGSSVLDEYKKDYDTLSDDEVKQKYAKQKRYTQKSDGT